MIINRKSWHYKVWDLGSENKLSEPKDLCSYFKVVMKGIFMTIVIVLLSPAWVPIFGIWWVSDWIKEQRGRENPGLFISYWGLSKTKSVH